MNKQDTIKLFQETIPNTWRLDTIGNLGRPDRPAVKAGPFGSALKKEIFTNSGYKIYGQEQVIAGDASIGEYYIDEQKYNDLISCAVQPGDILISLVGTLGQILIIPENAKPGIINPRVLRLSLDPKIINIHFAKYCLQSEELLRLMKRLSQGGTLDILNAGIVKDLPIPLPPLTEQRKIAEILGTWDAAIAKAERLVEALKQRKKALMQRLLTGEVRFPGFKDEWERKKIRDVFSRITDKNTIGSTNVLTASGQYGLVSQTEYFNRNVAGASLENYYLIYQGDFAYNRSSSDGYPFGAIKQLIQYELGIVSTLYICFRLSDTSSNIDFYRHYFEAGCLNRNIYSIAQEGARNHGLLNVGIDDFFNLELLVPCLEEQEIISTFFNNIDKNLQIAIEYYQKLLQQKRGLMQRLLSGEVRVSVESKAEELLPA